MKWVAVIAVSLLFDFASDVYFRALGHTANGVDLDHWDAVCTWLFLTGIMGLFLDLSGVSILAE